MSSPLRQSVEARSVTALQALSAVPKWAVFLAVLAVVVGGLLLTGLPALLLLGGLALLLGWLAYLAWPALEPGQRLLRLLTVVLVAASALARFGA
ncbi:MAG: hypothetical protein H0V64_00270 [Geodermatophilaceae bacterium]|nr:hypothetical protein [Geodermatophilaceae bacterium]